MAKKRALVVGGSLGGLFAANLLADRGWEVEVFERVGDDLAARGAGIGTHAALLRILAELGVPLDERLGIRSTDRTCLDRDGRELYRLHWGHVMSAWSSVYRPLKERFRGRYHFGRSFAAFAETPGAVTVRFADGGEASGELLVGADGLRSGVRAQLFPGLAPAYAGYVAWRGIVEERRIPEPARSRLDGGYWFVLPPGEMMLCYQVPAKDPRAGRPDWNFVWYRPVSDAGLRELSTDAEGRDHGLSMPPDLIRREAIAAVKADAQALLPAALADLVGSSDPFFQAIFDLCVPRLAAGRVALLGDAACVVRPHVGMGVTKAALDAVCLARSIERHPGELAAALARYDRLRGEFGRRCVARAQAIGAYIEARSRPERAWSAAQLDQSPQRLLQAVALEMDKIPELALEV